MGSWIPLVVDLVTALPNLIVGVETAFKSQPNSGPAKWISVEQSLSTPIQSLANEMAKTIPNVTADKVSADVSKFTKAVNDAVVTFYNDAGWPKSK